MTGIKYRGKSKENGEWVYGGFFERDKKNIFIIVSFTTSQGWLFVPVYEKTVGKYTGHKDKNGKEIYEDDIVSRVIYEETYHVIRWNSNLCRFESDPSLYGEAEDGPFWIRENVEIVGNDHNSIDHALYIGDESGIRGILN